MFANRIKEVRQRQHFSLTALAHVAGMPLAALSRLENGWTLPTLQTAERIALALGVDVGQLYDRPERLKSMPALANRLPPSERMMQGASR